MSSLLWTANLTQYIYSILGLKIFILIYLYVVNCYQRILLVEGFFFGCSTSRFTLLNFVDVYPHS